MKYPAMPTEDEQPAELASPARQRVVDALPDPEPAAPSLAEPDPGVFHHEPGVAPAPTPATGNA